MLKLKGYRVMCNLTQEEMAIKLGISLRSYVSKETGATEFTLAESKKVADIISDMRPEISYSNIFLE